MHTNKLSLATAVSLTLGLAVASKPEVNVYFGQFGTDTLASYCDAGGFDSVTLAFLSASPEADPATNYPATDFGTHCGTSVYSNNNAASHLLSGCTALSTDIQYCQRLGKKVLLSTGGVWSSEADHNYAVTTEANGEYFADFLWNAFGAFNSSWDGPRPFDTGSGEPTVLDGFDFDIEVSVLGQRGYMAMLKRLRAHIDAYNNAVQYQKVLLTGAPQCPLVDGWADMKELITATAFDRLWIQFYNNDLCQAGTPQFNYDEWEKFIENGASKNARLYVGLPASAGTTGYISADAANALTDSLRTRPSFGGVMVWDVAIAKENAGDGVPMYQAIQDHMSQVSVVPPTVSTTESSTAFSSTSSSPASLSSGNYTVISTSGYTQRTSSVAVTDTCTTRLPAATSSSVPATSASTTPNASQAPTVTLAGPSQTFYPVASAPRAQTRSYLPYAAVAVALFMTVFA